jgi:two-component system, chemotaxis family, chemotaxis protein CheY
MKRIIIADDSSTMRNFLKRTLVARGHDVVGEAENGFQAIQLYERLKPDLLIIDFVMPELTGIEVVRMILEIDSNAKIIMCTSMGQNHYRDDAIKSGVKGYIIKPFNPADIIKVVEAV